jgi:hypothetical protein
MINDAEKAQSLGVALEPQGRRLGRAEFQGLSDMPPELEWFATLDKPGAPTGAGEITLASFSCEKELVLPVRLIPPNHVFQPEW